MSAAEPVNVIAFDPKRLKELPPGHHRTGQIFKRGDPNVPAEALPRPRLEHEEHECIVTKRQAEAIVVTLAKCKGRLREGAGYCLLTVKIRGVDFQAREISWWRCLRAMRAELARVNQPAAE